VEARSLPSRTRCLVVVAVAGVHALVIGVFLGESRALRVSSAAGTPLMAFIVTRRARPRQPFARPSLSESSAPIVPLVEPITLAPPVAPASSASGQAIDWNSAARKAAAGVLGQRKRISFGFPPGGKSALTLGVPSPSSPAHHAGESDRTIDGQDTEWISERCYVISDPPLPGEPDFLKRARVTRGGCLPPPGPDPGELFKSLPAYEKHLPRRR
jgi:hypothetical protein